MIRLKKKTRKKKKKRFFDIENKNNFLLVCHSEDTLKQYFFGCKVPLLMNLINIVLVKNNCKYLIERLKKRTELLLNIQT